ncbi:NAD(P)/FAD-dependent oxidoreductase [Spectribacter hydrogenoxidans]|uniref:NAD(P)/FAD-dependent oxidoreductase n=1 Tax=Spectribacter hydrogenoxidans TaxID=3075608 RepID=A0ABU3BVU2_9GAMM|nr:NAD(P)/FAD-dependent oxidoreductase [Salinisphaera sp. W335]MDT0633414.1 NAD(P)/FAD-dependent oxidoreductase [Salinisphaera sp. W335]
MLDAVVVGAGFAGLYMVHLLRNRLGLSVQGIEAAQGVGGTWYWNRYPGARCDIESQLYCYSFSPELEQEWNWSERFPAQPEVLDYLNHVAERFDLMRSFTFDTRVVGADFDETTDTWLVCTDGGARIRARFFIAATGNLSAGRIPDFPGRDDFRGNTYFTGDWPHETVDFSGRRVALIGTGSTGVQLVPHVAQQAAALTVFQRTPAYACPLGNRPLDTEAMARIKANYPAIRQREWDFPGGVIFDDVRPSALAETPEARQHFYEQKWRAGGMNLWLGSYEDILVDERANETVAEFIRDKIRTRVENPDTAEKLTPRGYPFGAKRQTLEDGYYDAFNQDHVELVDVRTTPIECITPDSIRTADRDYLVDDIIFATGFDAFTGSLYRMNIRGRGGRLLSDHWAAGPRPYLGLNTSGFPNLFFITGPLSPSVLFNMPRAIEQHCNWVADCIAHLLEHDYRAIEAEPEAEQGWVEHVREVADATLLPKADSWYLGANVPGKPRVFMVYLGGCANYKKICDDVTAAGYQGFALTPTTSPDTAPTPG